MLCDGHMCSDKYVDKQATASLFMASMIYRHGCSKALQEMCAQQLLGTRLAAHLKEGT